MCAPEDEDKQIQWEPDRARWEPIDRTLTPNAPQMSRKFAAILLVLTCFDSFVVCKPMFFVAEVDTQDFTFLPWIIYSLSSSTEKEILLYPRDKLTIETMILGVRFSIICQNPSIVISVRRGVRFGGGGASFGRHDAAREGTILGCPLPLPRGNRRRSRELHVVLQARHRLPRTEPFEACTSRPRQGASTQIGLYSGMCVHKRNWLLFITFHNLLRALLSVSLRCTYIPIPY